MNTTREEKGATAAAATQGPAGREENAQLGRTRYAPRSLERCAGVKIPDANAGVKGGLGSTAEPCDPAACTREAHAEGPKRISEYLAVFLEPLTRRPMTLEEVRRALTDE